MTVVKRRAPLRGQGGAKIMQATAPMTHTCATAQMKGDTASPQKNIGPHGLRGTAQDEIGLKANIAKYIQNASVRRQPAPSPRNIVDTS